MDFALHLLKKVLFFEYVFLNMKRVKHAIVRVFTGDL